MDWMHNKYTAEYKVKKANMEESICRLYDVLGYCRTAPKFPATRRYDLDAGKVINLRGKK